MSGPYEILRQGSRDSRVIWLLATAIVLLVAGGGAFAAIGRRSPVFDAATAQALMIGWTSVVSGMVVAMAYLLARRTRQARDKSEAADLLRRRMLAIVNAVPVEFVEYDADGRMVVANKAARLASPWTTPGAAAGKRLEEIVQEYVAHFATPETRAAWQAWATQQVIDFERGGISELQRPDGQWRRSYVTDLPGGGSIVVRVDVTQMKQHEARLAAEMERLDSIFRSTGAAILMLNRNGRVLLANQTAIDIVGKLDTQVIGASWRDLPFEGFDLQTAQAWFDHVGAGTLKPVEFESAVARADGRSRIYRFTANPIQDEEGRLRYCVLIGVDDTDRRMTEVRLFDSARLANLGEMATGIAHEINQPLAVIRFASESLVEELDEIDRAQRDSNGGSTPFSPESAKFFRQKVERIVSQTERASSLIRDLRAVARKPADDARPFDLGEAARVACDLVREQIKLAQIEFSLDAPASGPIAMGEASRAQQVLINLVNNARDAILARDPPRVGAPVGRIAMKVTVDPLGGGSMLTVEDDGPGIPPHALKRLFEPFFTTKPVGKGTGLGLSISYDIVNRMGGDIVAQNKPGGGAVFRVVLPPAPSDLQQAAQ